MAEKQLLFAPFRLDMENECVWRNEQALQLPPKAFAVLHYLATHPNRLVSKKELFNAVWPGTVVSDAALAVCIQEIRKVLGDQPHAPQFIETMHKRGYRFIAPLSITPPVSSSRFQVSSSYSAFRTPHSAIGLVGREAELEQLHKWLDKALGGERQVVFVTGEAGIGKTTLVEAFLQQIQEARGWRLETSPSSPQASSLKTQASSLWIGRGQCIEHYGAGEAYMPVLEALGRLCREPGGEHIITLLGQYAPTWLVQMPALLSTPEFETLQRKVLGATRERMLREMAEALEVLTAERLLVLRLEDLQWSDISTLDLLSVLARRQERTRLLMICTYRPVDVHISGHPLKAVKQELQMHGQCHEFSLKLLTEEEVGQYLTVRFAGEAVGEPFLQGLVRAIHRRTEGNPLFIVNLVDYLVAQELLVKSEGLWELRGRSTEVEVGVPESLRQMIEKQIERLSAGEQAILEAASIVGAEFSAAAVAAAGEQATLQIEECCEKLVRHSQFLRQSGIDEWPDGTVTARYGFLHALYQNVLYERVSVGRRIHLHRQIGNREEHGYGARAGEIAAELALHFERGRDYRRAVQYLWLAGENASRRHAYREAIDLLTRGLDLLKLLPDTLERSRQELRLQTALGAPLMATKGWAASEVERVYTQARELCQQLGETPQLFPVLWGLWGVHAVQGKLHTACELGEQCLHLAQRGQDPTLLPAAHAALGQTLYFLGEFGAAQAHTEQGIRLYDPQQHRSQAFLYGADPGVHCRGYAAWTLWFLGYPDQALQRAYEALALAQEQPHPQNLAWALIGCALLHQLRREEQLALKQAEAVVSLSTEQGFALPLGIGTILWGWALAEQGREEEGIAQIYQGLTACRAMGAETGQSHFLALLAEGYKRAERAEEGLTVLAEAVDAVEKTGECFYEAGLYWLKGTLTLQSKASPRQVQDKSKQV